ncbi:MAG: hypothetical protein D6738_08500 [Acidobacteria bacterium]|nr:MAG: hypothetical protein D6738_08500 [Acidobacteriota bacterium]
MIARGEPERLREMFRRQVPDEPPLPSCPDDAEIQAAAGGELPPERLAPLLDHMIACPACAESWRMAVAIRRDLVRARRTGRLRLVGALAAATLVLASAVVLFRTPRPASPETRPAAVRGEAERPLAALVPDGAELPRDRMELRFRPAGPGSRYFVQVLTSGLAVLHESPELEQPRYVVPAAALAGVRDGETIYWIVRAVSADGRVIESAAHAVIVGAAEAG